jgi:hypothetical protein
MIVEQPNIDSNQIEGKNSYAILTFPDHFHNDDDLFSQTSLL